jgi:hypothetical protein
MPMVRIPNSSDSVFVIGTQDEADKTQALLDARHAFIQKYCKEQGWPADKGQLSITQSMQIRQQDGWKNPVIA